MCSLTSCVWFPLHWWLRELKRKPSFHGHYLKGMKCWIIWGAKMVHATSIRHKVGYTCSTGGVRDRVETRKQFISSSMAWVLFCLPSIPSHRLVLLSVLVGRGQHAGIHLPSMYAQTELRSYDSVVCAFTHWAIHAAAEQWGLVWLVGFWKLKSSRRGLQLLAREACLCATRWERANSKFRAQDL